MHLTPALREKVNGSAILMIVMSPTYLESTWCNDELKWFREQVMEREGRGRGRVFVVRAMPTDEKRWPDFLRDERGHAMLGFCFHDSDNKKVSLPFGYWGERNEAYGRAIASLLTPLVARLWELHDAESRTNSDVTKPIDVPTGPRRVYLHTQPEYAGLYDELMRAFSQDGIAPLRAVDPAHRMIDLAEESRRRIETAKLCDALALVRADGDNNRFLGDLLQIGWMERGLIEADRGRPLPCAVLDRSGAALPMDLSDRGIERFDLSNSDWHGKFRGWLDQGLTQRTASS
jgi:hypothetical protein